MLFNYERFERTYPVAGAGPGYAGTGPNDRLHNAPSTRMIGIPFPDLSKAIAVPSFESALFLGSPSSPVRSCNSDGFVRPNLAFTYTSNEVQ